MGWDYWREPIDGAFRIREPIGDANRRIVGYVLREDDARLIAAAPKTLESLRGLITAVEAEVNEKGGGGFILARLTDARDAVREATDGQSTNGSK